MSRVRRELERRGRLAAAVLLRYVPGADAVAPRGVWLFGAAVGRAYIDSSAALHRHVVNARPGLGVRWVIDRDSPHVASASAVGDIAFRDELQTWMMAVDARVHVISHGAHDVPACASRLTSHVLKVRLGHGLTALKRTKPRALHSNASANRIFDLVPVASEFERQNKRSWNIPDSALVVTGVPRFDELMRKTKRPRPAGPRRIVYMPTWRDWVPQEACASRDAPFVRAILELLMSPRLADVLHHHDAVLDVHLHRILRDYVRTLSDAVQSDRILIASPDEDVQDALAVCDAVVTDYSSVTWDALYTDKPVLFFQFDLDAYEADRGAYFDLRNDLPGPGARTADELIALIDGELNRGLALSDSAKRWQERAFAFRDDQNCARVLAAIESRLEGR